MNDCHSLIEFIDFGLKKARLISSLNGDAAAKPITTSSQAENEEKIRQLTKTYEAMISKLENEKHELTSRLNVISTTTTTTERINGQSEHDDSMMGLDGDDEKTVTTTTITAVISESKSQPEVDELKAKLDASEKTIDTLKEQLVQLNVKLNEMTSTYETTRQTELDEKNKIKHLERAVRSSKIEKDQLLLVNFFTHFNIFITDLIFH